MAHEAQGQNDQVRALGEIRRQVRENLGDWF